MKESLRIKRKITDYLRKWKADPLRVPLIVKGLRQVGKTSSVKAFAAEEYENAFFLDFRKDPRLHLLFDGDFSIDRISAAISILPEENKLIEGSRMVPHKTILVFDEIQDCPNARSSLRYFKDDGRFDVIGTGSMLGVDGYRVTKKVSRGTPVGSEEVVEMSSLDFEEFLWACGFDSAAIVSAKENADAGQPIPPYIHERLLELIRNYIVVGGLPEAVLTYLLTNDLSQVRKVQTRILNDYRADFGIHMNDHGELYVDETERARLLQVFESIPGQLARDNQKFQYSQIGHGARARTHYGSLAWLQSYGLIERCLNLSTIEEPLGLFAEDDHFKVYVSDIGLLSAMLDGGSSFKILSGELGLGKGFIYENLVADAFHKLGKPLYYYSRSSGLEIDFVTTLEGEPTLVEVKAKSGRAKSSRILLDDPSCRANRLLKLSAQNVGREGKTFTAPYYLAFHLLGK